MRKAEFLVTVQECDATMFNRDSLPVTKKITCSLKS